MRGENFGDRARLKGYMFEVVILELLARNGFHKVLSRGEKIREDRNRFIEVKGRGAWHQIDCLCDYEVILPFLFPVRMLGEVKFYSKPLTKDKIREFIGVIKDIQENYFVVDNVEIPSNRVTELGVYFAANGFDEQAERLAFAHNIKTISYKNNYIIDRIKNYIKELESNYLSVNNCLSEGRLNGFLDSFSRLLERLSDMSFREFVRYSNPANGINNIIENLVNEMNRIHSSFVASTSAGFFLHFIGYDIFPSELFEHTDQQTCEVYFSDRNNNSRMYWIVFTGDRMKRKFFFTPPESLEEAAFLEEQQY